MLLDVETRAGAHGDPEPTAFSMGARRIAVSAVLDRWLAPEYGYFKVQADDGALYILRHDLPRDEWELTLFKAPGVAP